MEVENLDVKSVLEDLGYKLQDSGPDFWMTKSLDRGFNKGQNLSVSKKNGTVVDFSGGSKYSIEEFVKLNNGEIDPNKLENFKNNNTNFIDELKLPKKFDKKILDSLIKDHKYWENRGISRAILERFKGGLADEKIMPKLSGRYLIPIFAENGEIHGFSARYVGPEQWKKKQKILGNKKNFQFPLYLNKLEIIEKRQILLCEGIGDGLSLATCGINNFLITFGLYLSDKLLSTIISLNPREIIICENFDENNAGQNGAAKMQKQLLNFFDSSVVKIVNPAPHNDINQILNLPGGKEKIIELYGKSI